MYQAHVRKLLVQEVITDELPLSSLEQKGLHEFMKAVCPSVQISSHETILSDCVQLFLDEKLKLKSFIKNMNQRVCITLDTWTPNQYVNYLCIIAHFIDNDWGKHKKILSFAPIYSDDGEEIGKVVEKCLHDWEIDNVLTISAGNISSTGVAVSYIKERLTNTVLDGTFLQSRCLIDLLNNMVKDVLNEYDDSFKRIRAAVLYVRRSSARTNNFKTCAKESGINFNHFMCLDFPDKWICTFGMLFTSENYEEAFNMFEIKDSRYRNYMEECCGVPNHDDWENARKISYILRDCFCLAEDMFGFATSDKYIVNLSRIDYKFQKLAKGADTKTNLMALKMREKYNKYWGDMKELNMLTCVASVLDPTYKMSFIEYYFKYVYNQEDIYEGDGDGHDDDEENVDDDDNDDDGNDVDDDEDESDDGHDDDAENVDDDDDDDDHDVDDDEEDEDESDEEDEDESDEEDEYEDCLWKKMVKSVLATISDLCNEYKGKIGTTKPNGTVQERSKKRKLDVEGNVEIETELDRYLNEDLVTKEDDDFDILLWWKNNSERFPILSRIAKDVLAIPLTAVRSMCAFKATYGNLIHDFRSSLPPSVVEALVCTEDWRDKSQKRKRSGRSWS